MSTHQNFLWISKYFCSVEQTKRTKVACANKEQNEINVSLPGTDIPLHFNYTPPVNAFDAYTDKSALEQLIALTSQIKPEVIILDATETSLGPFIHLKKVTGQKFALYHPAGYSYIIRDEQYALYNNAEFHLFADRKQMEKLARAFICPTTSITVAEFISGQAEDKLKAVLSSHESSKSLPAKATSDETAKKSVLFLEYFAGPCSTVGVQRINHWVENISKDLGEDYDVHVAASNRLDGWSGNFTSHHIPDQFIASVEDETAEQIYAAEKIEAFKEYATYASTLSFFWKDEVMSYFAAQNMRFDVVIISGNPFCIMEAGSTMKDLWGAKIILDYRDPLANNPVILYKEAGRQFLRNIELQYNAAADTVLVVNSACKGLTVCQDMSKIEVLENGFDEAALQTIGGASNGPDQTIETPQEITFCHAGNFNHYRRPGSFIEAIVKTEQRLKLIGGTTGVPEFAKQSQNVQIYDRMPYSEALEVMKNTHCGLLYLSTAGFETPTKLYDYLGLGLEVLILSDADPRHGPIWERFKDAPFIHWSINTADAISDFLRGYKPLDTPYNNEKYGRLPSLKQLAAIIKGHSNAA